MRLGIFQLFEYLYSEVFYSSVLYKNVIQIHHPQKKKIHIYTHTYVFVCVHVCICIYALYIILPMIFLLIFQFCFWFIESKTIFKIIFGFSGNFLPSPLLPNFHKIIKRNLSLEKHLYTILKWTRRPQSLFLRVQETKKGFQPRNVRHHYLLYGMKMLHLLMSEMAICLSTHEPRWWWYASADSWQATDSSCFHKWPA